jgi:hypothetical protein
MSGLVSWKTLLTEQYKEESEMFNVDILGKNFRVHPQHIFNCHESVNQSGKEFCKCGLKGGWHIKLSPSQQKRLDGVHSDSLSSYKENWFVFGYQEACCKHSTCRDRKGYLKKDTH